MCISKKMLNLLKFSRSSINTREKSERESIIMPQKMKQLPGAKGKKNESRYKGQAL